MYVAGGGFSHTLQIALLIFIKVNRKGANILLYIVHGRYLINEQSLTGYGWDGLSRYFGRHCNCFALAKSRVSGSISPAPRPVPLKPAESPSPQATC